MCIRDRFTGHKVIGLPHTNGKLDAGTVEDWCRTFYADGNMDHLVFPGTVSYTHLDVYKRQLVDSCSSSTGPLFPAYAGVIL